MSLPRFLRWHRAVFDNLGRSRVGLSEGDVGRRVKPRRHGLVLVLASSGATYKSALRAGSTAEGHDQEDKS